MEINIAPLIIIAFLQVLGLGVHLAKSGERINLRYNPLAKLIDITIDWMLLYWAVAPMLG